MVLTPAANGEAAAPPRHRTGAPLLWIGALAPPIVWKVRFWLSYISVPYACWWGAPWLVDLITGATLAVLAGCFWYAARARREARRDDAPEPARRFGRSDFLGLLGMLSAGLFFLVVFAEGLANRFVDACL